jgi:transcriptional regulator with XRE-family HTH domain
MNNKQPLNNILFNFFLDLRKKEINKRERATLLAKYLEDNNMSQRELARELGIPHSTIQDWLMINRISVDRYDKLIECGLTDTDIYKILRNDKQAGDEEIDKIINEINYNTNNIIKPNTNTNKEEIDLIEIRNNIKNSMIHFRPLIYKAKFFDIDTFDELKELINILNRIKLHYERQI